MRKVFGFSVLELILALIIIGVLSSLSIIGFQKQVIVGMEKKAKLNLEIAWTAEQDFFAYQGRYTNIWEDLQSGKPIDEKYDYKVTIFTHEDLEIRATSKSGSGKNFLINTEGEILEF